MKNKKNILFASALMLCFVMLGSCKLFKKKCDCPTWSKTELPIKKEKQV